MFVCVFFFFFGGAGGVVVLGLEAPVLAGTLESVNPKRSTSKHRGWGVRVSRKPSNTKHLRP